MLEFNNDPRGSQRRRSPKTSKQGQSQTQGQDIRRTEGSGMPPKKGSSKRRSRRSAPKPVAPIVAPKPMVTKPIEVVERPPRKRFFLLDLFSRSRQPRGRTRPTELPGRRTRQPQPHLPMQRTSPLVHAARMVIVGVGIGAIAGTSLSVWNPAMRSPSTAAAVAQSAPPQVMAANALSGGQNTGRIAKNTLGSGQEIAGLIAKITPLVQGVTDLTPGVFMIDLDKGDYYTLNGDMTFSAASTIKVPVLIAFFQDVDAGKVRLDEIMTMEAGDVADNSGDMQFAPVGTQYSALEVATNMIVISDNTATNMMIRRLGGIEALNQRFKQWGLQQTEIHDRLPDLAGTNITSPKELTTLLTAVSQGQLISMASRDRALGIMRQTETRSLLPAAIGEGATISHKTGDIKSMVGDTGIIDMPSGRRYVITTLMKRPDNDERAQELIRQIAGAIYDYLNPANTPNPEAPAADLDVPDEQAGGAAEPAAESAPVEPAAEPAPAEPQGEVTP